MLKSNNQITVHQRNLQVLMTEVFKIINGLSLTIMHNFYIFRENTRNIQNFQIISNENKNTVSYGQETIKFRTPSLWTTLPEECKPTNSLNILKRILKPGNAKHAPVGYTKLFKKVLVLSNFIYLFVCLFCFDFFMIIFYCLFHCCSNISSVFHTVERINE